jgi:hypothetical protein
VIVFESAKNFTHVPQVSRIPPLAVLRLWCIGGQDAKKNDGYGIKGAEGRDYHQMIVI